MDRDRIREIEELIGQLEAPEYWMSGSKDGHEGENDRPREAASALRQLLEERQWKPIEIAPKDGTWIMLRGRNSTGVKMVPVVVAWRWGEGLTATEFAWRDSASLKNCDNLVADASPGSAADWLPVPPEEGEGK